MAKGLGFLQELFNSLFGGGDPESEKKRQLRSISKNLSKTKYHFYKFSSHEAEPGLAKYFYEIYRLVSPAQTLFQSTNPAALKNVVIDVFLSDKQRKTIEEIDDKNIDELSRVAPLNEIEERLKKDMGIISTEFDTEKGALIDDTYNKLLMFKNFCSYDYYFLLRKFDSTLREHDFSATPAFQSIVGNYIADDLKNFISVAWALPFDDDWAPMFQLLKQTRSVEPLAPAAWKKIISRLKVLKATHALEMVIQLITENPSYEEKPLESDEHIVEPFLSQLQTQINTSLKKIQDRQTLSKVDSLLGQIFVGAQVSPLKNYTAENSLQFEKKNLGTYQYATPLSYLKAFLLDYTKKEIRDMSDILLIRGKWATPTLSKPMSDAYNKLLEISNQVIEFDDSLAEDVDIGLKLKTMLPRTDRDKDIANICNVFVTICARKHRL